MKNTKALKPVRENYIGLPDSNADRKRFMREKMKSLAYLKTGSVVWDRRLDRIDQKDPRSLNYPISAITPSVRYQRLRSYTWKSGETLNQGTEGACVGFAWTHELAARPVAVAGLNEDFARNAIYHPAQKCDQYPGGSYPGAMPFVEGTSVLAAAKVVRAMGYIREYRWAFDFWDLVAAVGYFGPAVFGCSWFAMMQSTDQEGFISPRGSYRGEHCILFTAVKIVKDKNNNISCDDSFFTFQNSWGVSWGKDGFGRLRFKDVMTLWEGAETCIPIGRRRISTAGVCRVIK